MASGNETFFDVSQISQDTDSPDRGHPAEISKLREQRGTDTEVARGNAAGEMPELLG